MNHKDNINKDQDSQSLRVSSISPSAESITPSFGQLLATLVKAYSVRSSWLAKSSGVSANLIAQYRRGTASCSVERAHSLAMVMGCTKAERIALTRAAALTTKDRINESIRAILIEKGIQRESIQSVAPSATSNEIKFTTDDGMVVNIKVSVGKSDTAI